MRYFRSAQEFLTCFVVILAPLPLGSAGLLWTLIWLVLLCLSLLFASWDGITKAQTLVLAGLAAVFGLYMLTAILQLLPNPSWLPVNPVWAEARSLLGLPLPDRVSLRAKLPFEGLSHCLLFFAATANGLLLGIRDDFEMRFWKIIAITGLIYAIYGLAANFLDPDEILFMEKTAYLGAVTASFVNRNTAATYFGTMTIIWFVLGWRSWLRLGRISLRLLFGSAENSAETTPLIRRIFAFVVCAAALVGTQSRGGILATFFGLGVVLICLIETRLTRRRLQFLTFATPVCVLAGFIASEAVSARLSSIGLFDQQRWMTYASALDIIHDFPWMGTGLGTFAEIFPRYRSPESALWGVWDLAHNTILEIAVEMGLPLAVLIATAYLVALWFFLLEASRASSSRRLSLVAVIGTTALGLAHSLIDFSLQIPGMMIPFAVLFGFGLARCFAAPTSDHEATALPAQGSEVVA